MGRLTLTELAYLLVTRREPTPRQTRILDAVLVSLADHGLTPSALAARLTYTGAPEAIQGAIAGGAARRGQRVPRAGRRHRAVPRRRAARITTPSPTTRRLRRIADVAVRRVPAAGERVPGLGHPVHKDVDPRTARLYELADGAGTARTAPAAARASSPTAHEESSGRHLPVNGAGAGGAALVDLGIPPSSVRGFVLIARTAGLVAATSPKRPSSPIGMPLWLEVEERRERRRLSVAIHCADSCAQRKFWNDEFVSTTSGRLVSAIEQRAPARVCTPPT